MLVEYHLSLGAKPDLIVSLCNPTLEDVLKSLDDPKNEKQFIHKERPASFDEMMSDCKLQFNLKGDQCNWDDSRMIPVHRDREIEYRQGESLYVFDMTLKDDQTGIFNKNIPHSICHKKSTL